MRFRPRNVRSRLTLWYVLVLASLLALYAGVASLFLFLSLREDFDQNLLQDLETVEGMLAKEPNGLVSLRASHPDAAEPRIGHFIEVWSTEGSLLYRSAALQDQALGGSPGRDEGVHDPIPATRSLVARISDCSGTCRFRGLRPRAKSSRTHRFDGHSGQNNISRKAE